MIRLLLALLMFASVSCQAGPLQVDKSRALIIEGAIEKGNILELGKKLLEADPSKGPMDLLINSPGGDVVTGFRFINQMEEAKANGLTIRCFVPEMAASMAFGIFVHCSERYALAHSFLLWHRARVMGGGLFGSAMTAPMARGTAAQLEVLDSQILREATAAMPDADPRLVEWHFENETLHTGESLHIFSPDFLTPLQQIPGLFDAMMDKKTPRSVVRESLFGRMQVQPGQIIYVAPNTVIEVVTGRSTGGVQ